jgi:hypothetical protein
LEKNNFKNFSDFLSESERNDILNFVLNFDLNLDEIQNFHIKTVRSELKGKSFMFNIDETEVSNYLSEFQSGSQVFDRSLLPETIINLKEKISQKCEIELENCFLQIIKMKSGGKIRKHYDSTLPGFINYKCNISLLSDDYILFTNGENISVKQNDLYCFEASLYRHWTEEFKSDRILLSFGFGLPLEKLGRNSSDPRVRMSQRIFKYFQK